MPFSRSIRSLQTDDNRTALVAGLITLPLFIAWLLWFFVGDVPLYEISEQLTAGEYDTVVATFPLAVDALPEPGAEVRLRLRLPNEDRLTTFTATVTDFERRPDGSYDVMLFPEADYFAYTEVDLLTGQAELAIDERSPFRYLLQQATDAQRNRP